MSQLQVSTRLSNHRVIVHEIGNSMKVRALQSINNRLADRCTRRNSKVFCESSFKDREPMKFTEILCVHCYKKIERDLYCNGGVSMKRHRYYDLSCARALNII
jgi:hypothetical protein